MFRFQCIRDFSFGALLVAVAAAWAGQASAQAAKPLVTDAQVQDVLTICFKCHGEGGVSTTGAYPTLAGQKAEYLHAQVQTFKQTAAAKNKSTEEDYLFTLRKGMPARSDATMTHMAQSLSDEMIAPVVRAISKLACDGGKPKIKRANVFGTPQKVLRCSVCHGQNGISTRPSVPNLAGQQRGYLSRQLKLLRNAAQGKPHSQSETWRTHRTMNTQAFKLTDRDIDEIARYFSELDCRESLAR